jgi:hypothetical protein
MNCNECNSDMVETVGSFLFNSKIIGRTAVPNIRYKECPLCSDTIISLNESKKVTIFVKNKEKEAIEKQPFDHFISMGEATEMLGYSKQAFSKNPKIRRGLIMFGEIDGRKYYLKKSVLLFKEKNNGLYPLPGYTKTLSIAQAISNSEIKIIRAENFIGHPTEVTSLSTYSDSANEYINQIKIPGQEAGIMQIPPLYHMSGTIQ